MLDGSLITKANLGRNQPMRENSIIIAIYDDQDARHERVLSLRQLGNELYVSANHCHEPV